ncbi:hypothetical protein [Alteromonas phage ZP6]|uniref:Uncharacterized protein n=1 Tax=Alteromonas phage ZP6 TaxID=2492447 RepID=A0A3S9U897_9CAUD|nr:hypothetical protein PQC03_gp44 [Alteromonas phage ZP6]AZS06547.1 hypothetical protein [Alteromonas phage ZP6]
MNDSSRSTSKFLLEGETFDLEEVERRLKADGRLVVQSGEIVRVADSCESNMEPFADKLVTWHCSASYHTGCIFYGDSPRIKNSKHTGVGFCYGPDRSTHGGEVMPLACIKTKARQALESLAVRLNKGI